MSRNDKNRQMHKVVDAEFTPIVAEEQQVEKPVDENTLNLEEVQFMIILGRKKDGQPFLHTTNLPDFFVADGLLDYGKREIDKVYDSFFKNKDKSNEQV